GVGKLRAIAHRLRAKLVRHDLLIDRRREHERKFGLTRVAEQLIAEILVVLAFGPQGHNAGGRGDFSCRGHAQQARFRSLYAPRSRPRRGPRSGSVLRRTVGSRDSPTYRANAPGPT